MRAAIHAAQLHQELVAVHIRHVPVEQDRVRHSVGAGERRLLTILGLGDLEIQPLENAPGTLRMTELSSTTRQ